MSAAVEERVRPRGAVRAPERPRGDAATALGVASELTTAAMSGGDVDALLALVAARSCELLGVRRCGVYLRERPGGRFTGRAAHPSFYVDDVRRTVVGGAADAFSREIVATGRPVLIRDTWSDPRAAQGALRAWRVRSVLGVPLAHDGTVLGLLFLDNEEEPHPYTAADVETAWAVARLAADAVARVHASVQAKAQLETVTRQNRLLRGVATADHRLGQVVLGDRGLRGIAAALAELTGKPSAICNAEGHRVAAAPAPAGETEVHVRLFGTSHGAEELAGVLRDTVPGSSAAIGPLLAAGVRHRHLVAPVDVGDDRWGLVIVMEHPSRLNAFDELVVRRAAKYVALELAAARRASTAAWDARSLLARQLIRGTQPDEVRRSAEHLGIELDVARVVGYVTARDRRAGALDAEKLVDALEGSGLAFGHPGGVLATKGPEGVAIVVELPPGEPPVTAVRRVKQLVAEVCAQLPSDVIAGLSAVSREPAGVPRAYREAVEVARCIESFAASAAHRVLAADDLGPGRLFLANGDAAAIGRFVDDVVGPLLSGEDGTACLVRTLHTFFDTGRSVRQSAARLRVHENTIRYRLARVQGLTGLDVAADAGDQLSVQMALLVLRLQGHPALPPFDIAQEPAA